MPLGGRGCQHLLSLTRAVGDDVTRWQVCFADALRRLRGLVGKVKVALPFRAQLRSAARPPPHWIKGRVRAVHLHLIDDLQQTPELSFRPAGLVGEPSQVLRWQIINRNAVGWKMRRPEFAERHEHAPDRFQICAHRLRQRKRGARRFASGEKFVRHARCPAHLWRGPNAMLNLIILQNQGTQRCICKIVDTREGRAPVFAADFP